MDNIKKEYRELDLFEIFQMLLRHWWIILLYVGKKQDLTTVK